MIPTVAIYNIVNRRGAGNQPRFYECTCQCTCQCTCICTCAPVVRDKASSPSIRYILPTQAPTLEHTLATAIKRCEIYNDRVRRQEERRRRRRRRRRDAGWWLDKFLGCICSGTWDDCEEEDDDAEAAEATDRDEALAGVVIACMRKVHERVSPFVAAFVMASLVEDGVDSYADRDALTMAVSNVCERVVCRINAGLVATLSQPHRRTVDRLMAAELDDYFGTLLMPPPPSNVDITAAAASVHVPSAATAAAAATATAATCAICREREATVLFVPCGHLCACMQCWKTWHAQFRKQVLRVSRAH